MENERFRLEHDSMGELQVPDWALWGAQTQRAVNNFPISGLTVGRAVIHALGLIKAAAARANAQCGVLDQARADAIFAAAQKIAGGEFDAHFPVDVFQTGSGTSTNMNANEVIARIASTRSGLDIHPNDHVNMSQSSNDVMPTVIHVSAVIGIETRLRDALTHLIGAIDAKAQACDDVVKTGRTHLMDAMPLRLSQELSGWSQQLQDGRERIDDTLARLRKVAQGGTAIGTGVNAPDGFAPAFCQQLSAIGGARFEPAANFFAAISCQDAAVEMSGQLRTLAVSVMKISNDLRWQNSGPLAGLAEIALPALQPGSSIMPGKVNPVIPEALCMVCAQVMGNDATIGVAGQSGNFQLNVMLPVIAHNLMQSIELLANGLRLLADNAITNFTVQKANLEEPLARNPILVTALNPVVGYELGAAMAKKAYAQGRPILDVAREMTDLDEDELRRLLNPRNLTQGGSRKP